MKKKLYVSGVLLLVFMLIIACGSDGSNPADNTDNDLDVHKKPKFNDGLRIKAGNNDLQVGTYASVPCVCDWNEDGKKDLLVGCFYYGSVYLFLNSGSDASPVFGEGSKLQADGADIAVAYG
ncbi:hypothetical protein ACFL6G_05030 [candidate division KSB1 bacterium]